MPVRWGLTFVDLYDAGIAALLGTVEGITEFLPISSTGHLILLDDLLGFQGPPGHVFEVVIQLGAILGVCWVYRERLLQLATRPLMPRNRHLLLLLLLGFLPAAVIGFLAHGFIKTVLFNPWVVSIALIVGGVAIIVIERLVTGDRFKEIDAVPGSVGLKVGFCQANDTRRLAFGCNHHGRPGPGSVPERRRGILVPAGHSNHVRRDGLRPLQERRADR